MKWFWAATGILAIVSLTGFANWPGTMGPKVFGATLAASLVVLLCGAMYGVFSAWRARRWQFGLGTWFLIVALAGGVCAIPANHYVVRRPQLQLIPAITELGGTATIGPRRYHNRLYTMWLMLIGETDLVAEFRSRPFSDEDLRSLSKHPSRGALTILAVDGSQVTDSGVAYVKEFSRLRSFLFCECNVTDNGLLKLADAMSWRASVVAIRRRSLPRVSRPSRRGGRPCSFTGCKP